MKKNKKICSCCNKEITKNTIIKTIQKVDINKPINNYEALQIKKLLKNSNKQYRRKNK